MDSLEPASTVKDIVKAELVNESVLPSPLAAKPFTVALMYGTTCTFGTEGGTERSAGTFFDIGD